MLHREVLGTGPTVVCLHSGGMSGRQWRRLAERLAPSYRVVLPDLLGSGANPPWPEDEPFELAREVAALREVLDGLPAPLHLVGHSYGGFLALALARERPAAVRSLAVYDPTAYGVLNATGDAEGLADLEGIRSHELFLDEVRGGGAEWYEVFVDYWNGPGTWRALPEPARAAFLRTGRKTFLEARALVGDRTPPAAYAPVSAPALLLGGERTPRAARRVLDLLARALPAARLRILNGAGHMGPITHADEVNALVAEHLATAGR